MKKSIITSSLTALAALCLCATAQAQGPVVVSDKDDYSPGETAMFSAAGFQAGELLDFSVAISDDNGTWVPDIAWADVPADASGGAEVDYVVPETWADKDLQLTVMGLSSGLIATTTFTDHSPAPVLSYSGYSISAMGNTLTISVNVSFASGSTGHMISDVKALITNLPGPDLGAVTLTGPGTTNGAGTWSASVTGVCGTTYTFDKTNTNVVSAVNPPHNFNNVDAPSPKPTAMTAACGPTNHAPVITPVSDVSVPLGQIAGCSGEGPNGGFGKSVEVAHSVEPDAMDTTLFHVYATFNGGNKTLIANISDVDGNLDLAGITLSQDSESFTFGPGSQTQSFSTMITATDNAMASAGPTAAGGNFTVQIIYNFTGFFSPLSNTATTKVKRGSGVPVKFQVFDCDGTTPITTGDFQIRVTKLSGITPVGLDVDDAGFSGDDSINFRWDPTGMQWIFNLKTNSTYDINCTYLIWADLGDGVTHNVAISIK
jgi:hypothetical protein